MEKCNLDATRYIFIYKYLSFKKGTIRYTWYLRKKKKIDSI